MHKKGYLVLLIGLLAGIPSPSWAQTEQRPISDFLNVQTQFDYMGWSDPTNGMWIYFDQFGQRAKRFGVVVPTTYDGRVTVRTLADGTAHVSLLLQTRDAVCWGINSANQDSFGYRPLYISQGRGQASLGDGMLRIEFAMASPETPLPSMMWIGSPDYPLESIETVINCIGQLRAGSGYPDGTPGFGHTTQIGLFSTGAPQGCPPEQDGNCFPAEKVQFKPRGR